MSIRKNQFPVPRIIRPKNVLVSVHDKRDLDVLVSGLMGVNPEVMFYSTGGTGKAIRGMLGDKAVDNYISVEEFTRLPEMEGGLVKTLHPKIHAGLLAERGNPSHTVYVSDIMMQVTGTPGVPFDVLAVNLYPFEAKVDSGAGPEEARVNIDIGGPAMLRSAAKNWQGVAVLSNPGQYAQFLDHVREYGGVTAQKRFRLALEAFRTTSSYDEAIVNHLGHLSFEDDISPELTFGETDGN